MSEYERAIRTVQLVDDAIGDCVDAIRSLDRLQPTQVRTFNGALDDLMVATNRLQTARERLLQRTSTGGPPDIAVPDNAGAITDGLRG